MVRSGGSDIWVVRWGLVFYLVAEDSFFSEYFLVLSGSETGPGSLRPWMMTEEARLFENKVGKWLEALDDSTTHRSKSSNIISGHLDDLDTSILRGPKIGSKIETKLRDSRFSDSSSCSLVKRGIGGCDVQMRHLSIFVIVIFTCMITYHFR